MALTDAKIRNLKPKDRPYKITDFDGLYIRVTLKGSKLWRFKYRILGKEKLLAIGAYPAVSLLMARNTRDYARTQIASGVDPSQFKRESAFEHKDLQNRTFGKVAEMYLNKTEKEGRAEATMKKNRWYLDMAIADFGNRPLSEITSPIVLRCLRKPEGRGHYETARRLRSSIGSVFRHAIAIGLADNDPTFALQGALI